MASAQSLRRAVVDENPYLAGMQEEVDCNHFDSSQIMSVRGSYQEVLMISPKDFGGKKEPDNYPVHHNSALSRQLLQIPAEDEGSFSIQLNPAPPFTAKERCSNQKFSASLMQ